MQKILTRSAVKLNALFVLLLLSLSAQGQIAISGNQTALSLIQKLVGNGVIVTSANLTCPTNANGIFTTTGSSNLGIDSGIILTSGQAQTVTGTPGGNGAASLFASTSNSASGDAQLTALAGQSTYDACILEFDFQPSGDTIKFDYVFSSEEYFGYSCSVFNDVFGFFLSGPGIVGSKNLAVIPNTSIPICVNSTTNPTTTQAGSTALCNAMGSGSPFTQYFVNNNSGSYVTHNGFTTVFTAVSAVIPCSTYHLKLAIADGSDGVLDSDTWIKAGSLTSNAIKIKGLGGGGLSTPRPYCVRGCLPGNFIFNRPTALPTPLVIKYQIVGTALNGVDYVFIPDSVIILGGASQATRTINPVPIFPATGMKTVKLRVLNPYSCGTVQIIDSAELDIYDSLFVHALTNDTSICTNKTINLDATGDPILTFNWSPSASVANPTSLHTTASPTASTIYTLTASLPSSGCPDAHDYVQVYVREKPTVSAGPDRTTCLNTPVQLNVSASPLGQPYTYTWTPTGGLSSAIIANPLANPAADVDYIVTVNPGAIGCDGLDTVHVKVLPNDFKLDNVDTAICKGKSINVRATGAPEFSYTWTPTNGVDDPFKIDPVIRADTSDKYVVTARFPGCPDIIHSFMVDVQPVPVVNAGPDLEMCQWDTLHLHATVEPSWYKYDLSWTPANALLTGAKQPDAVFNSDNTTDMQFMATTPIGCRDSDVAHIVVHPGNFATIKPEGPWGICPNDSIHFQATGGVFYDWSPSEFISEIDKPEVTVYPTSKTTYTLYITNEFGCHDTFVMPVVVHPEAIVELGEDIHLHPGESVRMDPKGNAVYFNWFPRVGLSGYNLSNPVISPDVNTRYIVKASTENGCDATDSINVYRDATVLDMPNAFTPGIGKELKIIRQGIVTLKYFRIFNRWGEKMFETTDVNKGWDGRYNGELQPLGVYIYSIEAVTDTGAPFVKQGNITLIR